MKILSFDASTAELHLSISNSYEPVGSEIVRSQTGERRYAAADIIPAVDALLKNKGWHKSDLDSIVVGIGPGSFTGIRVAVVTGRTLGQALNLPVLGISIFDCYAQHAPTKQQQSAARRRAVRSEARIRAEAAQNALPEHLCKGSIGILMEAGSNHCYVAGYQRTEQEQTDSGLASIIEPQCLLLTSLSAILPQANRWLASANLITKLDNYPVEIAPLPDLGNIAIAQSQIAMQRLSLMKPDGNKTIGRDELMAEFPYQSVRPLYLREPSITLRPNTQATTPRVS